jgi:hypothetical protein
MLRLSAATLCFLPTQSRMFRTVTEGAVMGPNITK